MAAAFLVWSAHLAVVYGVAALGCARGFSPVWAVGAATALAAAALAALLSRALWRGEDGPAAGAAGLALVAVAWGGLPALIVPACG